MRVFDLHCDTIGECYKQDKKLKENDLHICLDRVGRFERYTQVYAIWIPDEYRGETAVNYFNNVANYFYKEIEENKNTVSMYSEASETPCKAILAVEGGSACGNSIEGLLHLYNRGVRAITLTWNDRNEIAGGAFSEGGFTDFGKEFVKECHNLGIVIDVSHLNRESFSELCDLYDGTFIATHSNADIVDNEYARKRNLTDEQISVIRERKGLIGLNFCRDFLHVGDECGAEGVYNQVVYFLERGCQDIIALGSDYDGCTVDSDINGVETLRYLYNYLLNKGLSPNIVDKLFYENAERFFSKI